MPKVSFDGFAGQTYYVQVSASPIRQYETGNPDTAVGTFQLAISVGDAGPSPGLNDQIGSRIADHAGSRRGGGHPQHARLAGPGSTTTNSRPTPPAPTRSSGTARSISRFDSGGFEPLLQAYDVQGRLIASDADGAGNLIAALTFDAAAGSTYYLQASALDQGEGDYVLTIQGPPSPNPTQPKYSSAKQVSVNESGGQVMGKLKSDAARTSIRSLPLPRAHSSSSRPTAA